MKEFYKYRILQNGFEITEFCKLLNTEGVRSYLEIGSKFGGSFWRVGCSLPRGSRLVSVDFRDTKNEDGSLHKQPASLAKCVSELNRHGYDAHLIVGNSRDADTIAKAAALGPYDAVFIDADHSVEGVTLDWENYGPLGRIVAFHDVAWNEEFQNRKGIRVPVFWNEIKKKYRYTELKYEIPGKAGIGVLWR